MSKSKVTIVILNWNGADMLRRFLPSVLAYSQGERVEICVADNASTDLSCEVVEKEFPSVRLIRTDRNYGFAEGYNKVLEQVDAEYVVLLNNDVEVSKNWLTPMVEYMDAHPKVAACQPKILNWGEKTSFEYAGAAGGFIDRYGYPFCRGRIFDVIEEDRGQYDSATHIFWATGAALLIRLDVYREVGGLDGRFFAHMEEIDLCWRLHSRGYQVVCLPLSEVYHIGGATLKKENPHKTFLNFRNNLLMLYKNLPAHELNSVMCIRKILDYISACVFLMKGEVANYRAVLQARKEYAKIRSLFKADRETNLLKAVTQDIPERTRFCIIWKSKVRRKKTYADIMETR